MAERDSHVVSTEEPAWIIALMANSGGTTTTDYTYDDITLLRKYVLTKKLGVKQSIYWNLVSYVSLGRAR